MCGGAARRYDRRMKQDKAIRLVEEIRRRSGQTWREFINGMAVPVWHGKIGTIIVRECAEKRVPDGYTREGAIRYFTGKGA